VAAGTERARLAVRRGEARLVVVASDAAEGQLKKIDGIVRANGVPRVVLVDRVGLGSAVGGPPLSALAVTDSGLAKQVLSRLSGAVPKESRFK
jgi:ribosomal protein L7Ae-like RNA K-turn-binding protein